MIASDPASDPCGVHRSLHVVSAGFARRGLLALPTAVSCGACGPRRPVHDDRAWLDVREIHGHRPYRQARRSQERQPAADRRPGRVPIRWEAQRHTCRQNADRKQEVQRQPRVHPQTPQVVSPLACELRHVGRPADHKHTCEQQERQNNRYRGDARNDERPGARRASACPRPQAREHAQAQMRHVESQPEDVDSELAQTPSAYQAHGPCDAVVS